MNSKVTKTKTMKAPSPWYLRKPVLVGLVVALIIAVSVQAFFLIRMSSQKEVTTDLGERLDRLMLSMAGQGLRDLESEGNSPDDSEPFSMIDEWRRDPFESLFSNRDGATKHEGSPDSFWQSPFDFGRDWFRQGDSWQTDSHMTENDREYQVTMSIPGMEENELEVSIEGRTLTVTGKREVTRSDEKPGSILLRSNTRSHLKKTFTFPGDVLSDRFETRYVDGKLIITVTKAAEIS